MNKAEPDCISNEYESLSVGCSRSHEMEFKSTCPSQSNCKFLYWNYDIKLDLS